MPWMVRVENDADPWAASANLPARNSLYGALTVIFPTRACN